MAQGKPTETYEIVYSVDIKRNITIWRGAIQKNNPKYCFSGKDMFARDETPTDGCTRDEGARLRAMEKEIAATLTREEIINAFLEFRREHPRDGCGGWFVDFGVDDWRELAEIYAGYEEGREDDRTDGKQVVEELARRNREYIKEFRGEQNLTP